VADAAERRLRGGGAVREYCSCWSPTTKRSGRGFSIDSARRPVTTDEARRRDVVAVSGASGLIGSALVRALECDGHEVRPIVRRQAQKSGEVVWDPRRGTIDAEALRGVGIVVHLAGESIDQRWSPERKRRIRESRLSGTSLLAHALSTLSPPPRLLLSASAIGYYGDRGDEVLDESSGWGTGFLASLCREWEAATQPAAAAGIRVVTTRNGLVLSPNGGLLARILPIFRYGGGGQIGNGQQWMSWIALPDHVRAMRFLFDAEAVSGPVNLVAPEPVPNADFTSVLGDVLHRPTLLRVPAVAVRLALGSEMASETALSSQRVIPRRLVGAGFTFECGDLRTALERVL
jgi:uncharacterized protein